jgi:hypothetical protein
MPLPKRTLPTSALLQISQQQRVKTVVGATVDDAYSSVYDPKLGSRQRVVVPQLVQTDTQLQPHECEQAFVDKGLCSNGVECGAALAHAVQSVSARNVSQQRGRGTVLLAAHGMWQAACSAAAYGRH